MKKMKGSSFLVAVVFFLVRFISFDSSGVAPGFFGRAEGKKSFHIPDELDDVEDGEEDDAWKEWGRKRPKPEKFDPPPDFSEMNPTEIQAEMLKRQSGPSYGFVKLRLGVRRSKEILPQIAMQWTNILRTGSLEAKFMAVDLNTIMFTMEKGQDIEELKDFILSQQEAYEIKIGDLAFRRPGDPPLEQVMLHKKAGDAVDFNSPDPGQRRLSKDEF